MNLEHISTFHFMEELQECSLYLDNMEYIPVGLTASNGYRVISPAIMSSVFSISKCISQQYVNHIDEVLFVIMRYGVCEAYVNALGYHLFEENEFSWRYFRAFLALVCELSTSAFKKGMMFLTDDFVITTATYIGSKLLQSIERLGGCRAFQLDCVKSVMKMKHYDLHKKQKCSMMITRLEQPKIVRMGDLLSCPKETLPPSKPCKKLRSLKKKVRVYKKRPTVNSFQLDLSFQKDAHVNYYGAASELLQNDENFENVSSLYNAKSQIGYYDSATKNNIIVNDNELIAYILGLSVKVIRNIKICCEPIHI